MAFLLDKQQEGRELQRGRCGEDAAITALLVLVLVLLRLCSVTCPPPFVPFFGIMMIIAGEIVLLVFRRHDARNHRSFS